MHWLKGAVLAAGVLSAAASHAADELKPFVLAFKATGDVENVAKEVRSKLSAAGLQVVGEYSPYSGADIIGVTSDALRQAAAKSEFGGYGAVQRVALTEVDGEVQVSYTNPAYMADAYHMGDDLAGTAAQLKTALGAEQSFGPKTGLTADDLRDYHYMFGMPYFDDPLELADHASYKEAVATVEANLKAGVGGASEVWRVDLPGKEQTVFGVGMKAPKNGDKNMDDGYIMHEIDFKPLRSTAHLPYEVLVSGSKVYTLPAQFRIAINFPDLKMVGSNSFVNIMQAPDAIKATLSEVAGAAPEKKYAWE